MPGLSLRALHAVPTALLGAGLLLAAGLPAAAPEPPATRAVERETGGSQRVGLLQEDTPAGDVERGYVFSVPSGPTAPRPVVVALHGRAQSIEALRRLTGLERLGEREGFVSVFPGGYGGVWNAGTCCASRSTPDMPDVAFLDQVLADVARRTAVDPTRVHVVGYSNGGMMAYRYACERSSRLAGLGVVSGSMAASAEYADPEAGPDRCRPDVPLTVVAVHGAKDTTVPYRGGTVAGSRGGSVAPVRGGVDQSAVAAGCTRGRSVTAGPTVRLDYTGCAAGTAVRLLRLEQHGHGWSRDVRRHGVDTTEAVWSFLRGRRAATAA